MNVKFNITYKALIFYILSPTVQPGGARGMFRMTFKLTFFVTNTAPQFPGENFMYLSILNLNILNVLTAPIRANILKV